MVSNERRSFTFGSITYLKQSSRHLLTGKTGETAQNSLIKLLSPHLLSQDSENVLKMVFLHKNLKKFRRSSKTNSKDHKTTQYISKHISIAMEVPNKYLNNHTM